MADPCSHASALLHDLSRLHAGDETARGALIEHACGQLTRLTRTMLRGFPRVHRWEETDDVLQNASLRLWHSLKEVKPRTPAEFFGLAATQIRRELLDLTREFYGPQGAAAHHDSVGGGGKDTSQSHLQPIDTTHEPESLARWTELHRAIEALDDEERQMFDLLYYQELTQVEAAQLIGISERTVRKRWRSARLHVATALHGEPLL